MCKEAKYCSLNLRRIDRPLVAELYDMKWISNQPVYSLVQQAIEYWLENVGRPTWIAPYAADVDNDNDEEVANSLSFDVEHT